MNTLTDTHFETIFDVALPLRPYPGLRPFEKHEWPIFFGRERMIDEVISRLIGQQFIVVHGDSGSGKSSLIRAGVLSRLEQESARGGIAWRTASMLPRDAPLRNFAQASAEADDRGDDEDRITEIRRILNFGLDAPQALADLLRRGTNDHLCILVDQFEELFAFARRHGSDEARLFVAILIGFAKRPPPGLYLIITMRSEFLGACAQYPGLAETVNQTQYLLPPMTHADLVRAIREPALLYDGDVSLELAERLIADAGNSQDQLPLIQHGLMLLHCKATTPFGIDRSDATPGLAEIADARRPDRTPNWRLTVAALGPDQNLADLLSRHADETKETVEPEGTGSVLENLFRALTEFAEGKAIRRPQTLADLVAVTGVDEERVREIVDPFRAEGISFLRPYGKEPIADTDLIDISHEALMRCWQRMADPKNGWLVREFRSGLIWQLLLVQAEDFEKDSSNILSPAMTEERVKWLKSRNAAWAERYGGGWERVQALITASRAAAAEARRRDEERAAREHELLVAREQKRKTRHRWLFALGLIFILSVSLPWVYWQKEAAVDAQMEAERQKERADAVSIAAQQERDVAREKAEQVLADLEDAIDKAKRSAKTRDKALKVVLDGVAPYLRKQVTGQDSAAETPVRPVSFDTDKGGSPLQGSTGFMWIGSAEYPRLKLDNGVEVPPAQVRPGNQYLVIRPTVVREALPAKDTYRTAPAIGSVDAGTRIQMLGIPEQYPRDSGTQYWARIRVEPDAKQVASAYKVVALDALLSKQIDAAIAELSRSGQPAWFQWLNTEHNHLADGNEKTWKDLYGKIAADQGFLAGMPEDLVKRLKSTIGMANGPSKPTVWFQFAGAPRTDAQQVAIGLKDKNYIVPGEDRLETADGLHEVRYFYPADREMAQRLADDTEAVLGELRQGSKVTIALKDHTNDEKKPQPGVLELWLDLSPKK